MTTTPRRRFTILDAMLLIAAAAVSFFLLRWNLDERAAHPFLEFPIASDLGIRTKQVRDICVWSELLTAPLTFAMLLAGLGVRGGPRRERMRQPGLAACFSAVLVWTMLRIQRTVLITLEYVTTAGAHPQLPSPPFHTVMLPFRLIAPPPDPPDYAKVWLPFDGPGDFPMIGLAVGLVWLVLVMSKLWQAERTWLDRACRLVGGYWLISALVCWLTETMLRFLT